MEGLGLQFLSYVTFQIGIAAALACTILVLVPHTPTLTFLGIFYPGQFLG
jgi:hypothetical protein